MVIRSVFGLGRDKREGDVDGNADGSLRVEGIGVRSVKV
jgi:hypothetical protein